MITPQTNLSTNPSNLIVPLATDILLSGAFIQLPIDATGTDQGRFLTSGAGAVYNGLDFWRWGSPVYNYSIAVNGVIRNNGNGWVSTPTVTDTSSGILNQAIITGTPFTGLNFTRVISFLDDEKVVTIQDSLTNVGTASLARVATLDNTDPDQGIALGTSNYQTQNDVIDAGAVNNLVLASFNHPTYPNGLTVGFGSASLFQIASAQGFSNLDPYAIINSPIDPNGTSADIGINLAMDYGSLNPGQSVSSTWYITFGDSRDEAIANYLVKASRAIVGTSGDDTLTGTPAADIMLGLSGNDIIDGSEGDDQIDGGSGNDQIDGGSGNDIMIGGIGNDKFTVDSSGDRILETLPRSRGGFDTVEASVNWILGDNLDRLNLLGSSDINGTGNALNNRIVGNSGINRLFGGDGNDNLSGSDGNDFLVGDSGSDMLDGNLGSDRLTGGAGRDSFFLSRFSFDILLDFTVGEDSISIVATRFNLTQSPGVLAPEAFALGTSATNSSDRFIYDSSTGSLFFDPDGSDAKAKFRIARLSNTPALSNTDFQVL